MLNVTPTSLGQRNVVTITDVGAPGPMELELPYHGPTIPPGALTLKS
ncbi:hypothetical protein FRUB_06724 [Fimbriiglobus ruber]|uniref:Uncharacterized protein n=1 Tax=Fimbriiglobus ruber TaxID=1908690 RepID=A0A225DD92_9BACT|nr:hypothetical protein FRUB_06724 [Fimbriiglobus ruber]